ncbi:hypothetical protein HMPREF3130_08265 [Corynebacterium sp. HMSC14B06]|uniref:hypothetical protein n=1 Tax=Corynebacterium sp. HMSC14B06 TaxID=1581098 RepID=UPI0008A29AD4|nr:hypothetical protein [Corynebacterium sp. HMSC14B06]OFT69485.1 hypothetical protein HMPREF3130_08265 [Corynebacterium sp. HMSC14B06]
MKDTKKIFDAAGRARAELEARLQAAANAADDPEMWAAAPALLRDLEAAGQLGTLQWHRDALGALLNFGVPERAVAKLAGVSQNRLFAFVTTRAPGLKTLPVTAPPAPTEAATRLMRQALAQLRFTWKCRKVGIESSQDKAHFDAGDVAAWLACEKLTELDRLAITRGLGAYRMAGLAVADVARLMDTSSTLMSARLAVVPGSRPLDPLISRA